MKSLRFLLAAVAALGLVSQAQAHDPGLSTAQADLRDQTIQLATSFAPSDAQALLPPELRSTGKKWTAVEFEAAKPRLLALAPSLWELSAGGKVLTGGGERVELAEGDSVTFTLTFPRSAKDVPLVFRGLKLGELPSGHRQYVVILDERGGMVAEKLLSAKNPTVELAPASPAGTVGEGQAARQETGRPSAVGFVKLGVQHIWEGYDHLLFLFGLLIVCRTFKSVVGIITCFTLAHSLTLALATLNVVNLPSRFVESMIAASIVFVGVENLVRRGGEPKGRWALTFAFGLIHGFGFASVLRELGVGRDGVGLLLPLFTFNLGVEIGQVAVAAVVLPLIWRLRKNEMFLRRGVPALSAAVALAGTYWLLERTLSG